MDRVAWSGRDDGGVREWDRPPHTRRQDSRSPADSPSHADGLTHAAREHAHIHALAAHHQLIFNLAQLSTQITVLFLAAGLANRSAEQFRLNEELRPIEGRIRHSKDRDAGELVSNRAVLSPNPQCPTADCTLVANPDLCMVAGLVSARVRVDHQPFWQPSEFKNGLHWWLPPEHRTERPIGSHGSTCVLN